MAYKIDSYLCVGCEACFRACQFGAVEIVAEEHNCRINPDNCVECGECAGECPVAVITLDEQSPVDTQTDKNWSRIWIEEEGCIGCSKCQKNCPAGAIEGEKKHPFHINESKCIKCGLCIGLCPKKTIYGEK